MSAIDIAMNGWVGHIKGGQIRSVVKRNIYYRQQNSAVPQVKGLIVLAECGSDGFRCSRLQILSSRVCLHPFQQYFRNVFSVDIKTKLDGAFFRCFFKRII